MNAVSIGPLVFAGDRLAAIIAIGAFMTVAAILSARVDPRYGRWSAQCLVAGLAAARLGHVIGHLHVLLDKGVALPRHYGTPGLPATLFIAAGGRLLNVHIGEISRETLTGNIARLLAK